MAFWSTHALAQEDAAPDAKQLLEQGRASLLAGRTDEACALFGKAVDAKGGSAAIFETAQCHEIQGKTATAWREYTAAYLAASDEGETARADRSRGLAGALAPRLSKLRVDVTSPIEGEVVKQNGAAIDMKNWGALVIVDPGTYAITASAPGTVDFVTSVTVKADGDAQIVVVPRLRQPVTMTLPAAVPAAPASPGVVRTISPIGVAAFVTTSFGALGIAMGTVFGVMALNEAGDAKDDPALCPNKVCSPAGIAVVDEARTKGTISTVAFSVGGTSLATGIVLFLVKELVIEKSTNKGTPKQPKVEVKAGLVPADRGDVGILLRFD